MPSIKSKADASARGCVAQYGIWIDGLAIPPFPVTRPEHDLEMQVRHILGRIARRADVAQRVALLDLLTGVQAVVIALEMRVVVHELLIAIRRIDRDAAERAARHSKDH